MANPPNHFFKFIPPDSKFNLSIPKSFLTKLDGWRGKKATLRRGCHTWAVHIGDGGVFGDGWRKFVVENGVQEFDIIVFKHQGNMVFDFFVFDPSTCERQYSDLPDNVEVSLPESDSLHTLERSRMLKKRKRTDYSSQGKDKCIQLDDDSCFVTIMTPYNITSSRLIVPMEFARSNGLTTKRMHTQVVLVDEAKRTCPAKLHIMTRQVRLTGWRKLMSKNNLKVGDVCMFKLVEDGEVPVFNFYNLGKKKTNNHIQVKKESRPTIKIKKKTSSSLGNHPYFILTMKPSYREWGVCLPIEFSKSNRLKAGEIILRNDKGRSWKIQLKKKGEKYYNFGCGFRDFWDENGLEVGDDYKFVLVQKEKGKPPIMNVSLNVDSVPSGKEDPSYYIGKVNTYSMYLPSKLARTNGLLNKEEMILKNDDEMSWTMGIKRERNSCYIGRGWKDFCAANGLKKGERIKLELVSYHILQIREPRIAPLWPDYVALTGLTLASKFGFFGRSAGKTIPPAAT
uniref:Auxin response factor n=1 Tax=Helianthus annuus TaxID=4232 RepID=F1C963_HELAN|nr:auxin response factor [Helianthus annuus]